MVSQSTANRVAREVGLAALMQVAQRFAQDESDSDATRSEKTAIFLVAGCCCVAGLAWSAMYAAVFGFGIVAVLPLSFTVLVGAALVAAHITGKHLLAVYVQITAITLITAALQWNIGGMFDSGFVIAWAFLGPIGALFFLSFRQSIPWFILYVVCLVITVAFDGNFATRALPVSSSVRALFFLLNLSVSSLVVFVFVAYLVNAAATQRKRADSLLTNALPAEIVKALKSGATTIADHYDSATVLFADIVDSTPLFAGLSPDEVVDWLNEVFSAFDRVVIANRVEKIRTIGDNYMVAAGLPTRRADHAQIMARVALEMCSVLTELPPRHGRSIQLRFGMNSGPLVAGVIGRARLQYDLWGDTVNLAARMESHGEPGRVQLTDATHALIEREFHCELRGTIPIKGKGQVRTWFLVGPATQ
jgi:adenylate cyclase